MTIYRKSPSKTLQNHDEVIFTLRDGSTLHYSVNSRYLDNKGGSNSEIFIRLGIDRFAVATGVYGYKNNGGGWPECNDHDYQALTRLVRVLFSLCSGKSSVIRAKIRRWTAEAERVEQKRLSVARAAARKAEAKKQAALRRLSKRGRAALAVIGAQGFGCQRAAVIKLVGVLLGEDLSAFV